MNEEVIREINRLNFEDFLWIIFIVLSILNIIAGDYQKKYLLSNKEKYQYIANNIFTIILFVTLIIYFYFLNRNYQAHLRSENKSLSRIKVIGSIFYIVGVICLIYFQLNTESFIGTPA